MSTPASAPAPVHTTTPFALPRTDVRTMRAANGAEYRVLVAWPAEPAPPAGYPTIYLLDANATFGTLVEAVRTRSRRPESTGVAPALVVGVGYPVDEPYDRARRTFDFTAGPPALGGGPESAPRHATGGAEQFRAFLEQVLVPAIERDFAADPARRALVGHSLGGLFVLETLLADRHDERRVFRGHVAVSPSLWWDRDRLLAGAERLARDGADVDVVLSVGEYEETLAPWQTFGGREEAERVARRRAERGMVSDLRALADRLAAGAERGVRVWHETIAGEDHASVVPVALGRALRVVAGA